MTDPADKSVIGFQVDPALRERIERAAERDHRGVSSWLRRTVERELDRAEQKR